MALGALRPFWFSAILRKLMSTDRKRLGEVSSVSNMFQVLRTIHSTTESENKRLMAEKSVLGRENGNLGVNGTELSVFP